MVDEVDDRREISDLGVNRKVGFVIVTSVYGRKEGRKKWILDLLDGIRWSVNRLHRDFLGRITRVWVSFQGEGKQMYRLGLIADPAVKESVIVEPVVVFSVSLN
jgi:hypothetical protein